MRVSDTLLTSVLISLQHVAHHQATLLALVKRVYGPNSTGSTSAVPPRGVDGHVVRMQKHIEVTVWFGLVWFCHFLRALVFHCLACEGDHVFLSNCDAQAVNLTPEREDFTNVWGLFHISSCKTKKKKVYRKC